MKLIKTICLLFTVISCNFFESPKCGSRNNVLTWANVPATLLLRVDKDMDGSLCFRGSVSEIKLFRDEKKFTWKCNDADKASVNCSAPIFYSYERPDGY